MMQGLDIVSTVRGGKWKLIHAFNLFKYTVVEYNINHLVMSFTA